jgi:tRNA (guanine37-N1)-methyltransferase
MNITLFSIFPELLKNSFEYSLIKKAVERNIINIDYIDIRDYSKNKHKKVDDYPYSGGPGMLLKPEPLFDAIEKNTTKKTKVYYMSPKGKLLNQEKVRAISNNKDIAIIAGHYEGIDQRIIDSKVDEVISIGDYILTGGELPALVLIDAVVRLIPGVLGNESSHKEDSHENNLLEHPQYTRPYEFKGKKVPDILLSGNHEKIKRWKKFKSIELTLKTRPDLIEDREKILQEYKILKKEFE